MGWSSTIALGGSLALTVFAQAAFAQQNLPAMPGGYRITPHYEERALNPFGQGVPGINAQDLPGGGRRTSPLNIPLAGGGRLLVVDKCSLADVNDKELGAMRDHIVELLKKDAAATKSFLDAESWIEKGCARERVAFYVKALARIKG
jgi:hypothetical protein